MANLNEVTRTAREVAAGAAQDSGDLEIGIKQQLFGRNLDGRAGYDPALRRWNWSVGYWHGQIAAGLAESRVEALATVLFALEQVRRLVRQTPEATPTAIEAGYREVLLGLSADDFRKARWDALRRKG